MEVDMWDTEDDTKVVKKSKQKQRKRKVEKDGKREKEAKRIFLSLTKPLLVLGLDPKPLRLEHRARLRHLLRRLVNRQQWVAASGVLSAYMKGTLNDTSPHTNRLKFWALLELLKHVENHSINTTRIKNLYDIWSKKIGSMKTWPVESRYAVHLEFMVFCLLRGHAEDAYHLALCLEQEKGDIGPMLKMMMGLTFYELWYSSIPKEFQVRNSDQFHLQENSDMEEASFSNENVQSERYNSVESHMADSQSRRDSDASVMNGGLDLWLLPLRFSDEHSFEDFVYSQRNQPNHHYKNAVKYLQLALRSEPSASAALLPLIQVLPP
ncbi:hypothetical protein AAZX31_13G008900 [Glycine max]|uniref:Uncharacterized protein n=1 Tax=Glycine max TaxID=3847 RepID=A0A0R0GQS5_SOYBN|nr:hypothetical protein JHK87_034924 [Glycine soja]KAH1099471.1 hypothetical protein GYH30_034894 [Glycine max]KAH1099472.1 hypothetical protein GYH30_034894 [Glycine max]KRH17720.1 hypothetical protein GLYMA_13G009900v4 [Glycine max]KRH17721.1 hypothetical protein GLYMA_13G009900v4 [Glycine max]